MALTTLFVDLNAFFASAEQQLRPELRGRPVAVVPVEADTSCCIAASYEARPFGVRTGTRIGEAKRLCPSLELVPARPAEYVRLHHEVIRAAETCVPVAEVHSIDEFACRLTGPQRDAAVAQRLAVEVKAAIQGRVGECLRSSVGIAPNRFLAKVASGMRKPDGLVVIKDADLPEALFGLSLRDLHGIGPRMHERLISHDVRSVEELCRLPEREMERLWGSVVGRWWWAWLRGQEVGERPSRRRSVGHQHVLPPEERGEASSRAVAVRLLHKAAARMRGLDYWARRMTVWIRFVDGRRWKAECGFPETQDTRGLVEAFVRLWAGRPGGSALCVGVTLHELVPRASAVPPLFESRRRDHRLAQAMDLVNDRFGRDAVYMGGMHGARSSAPMRISFNSIPKLERPGPGAAPRERRRAGRRNGGGGEGGTGPAADGSTPGAA